MSMVRLRRDRHVIRETPVGRFLRKRLKYPPIFTYFNMETGQWILCFWINKGAGLAYEIDDLGRNFELVTAELVQTFQENLTYVDKKALKDKVVLRAARSKKKKDDEILADQERWDWMKKKTQHKSPVPYV